jgi:hypothetical protein
MPRERSRWYGEGVDGLKAEADTIRHTRKAKCLFIAKPIARDILPVEFGRSYLFF